MLLPVIAKFSAADETAETTEATTTTATQQAGAAVQTQ